MAKLFNRLATSYTAGIDLRSAYQRETENGSPSYRLKAKQVCKGLKSGKPLAESMALADGYFPELALSVVKAGEVGGRLEESFSRLGKHYDNLVKFRNGFLAAIAWPAFELVFAILLVGGLMAICDSVFRALRQCDRVLRFGGTVVCGIGGVDRGDRSRLVWYAANADRHANSLDWLDHYCFGSLPIRVDHVCR